MADTIGIPAGLLLQMSGWAWTRLELFSGPNAYGEADARARALGMSTGSMQYPAPTACFLGDVGVSKWRGLDARERLMMDGVILTDGRAEGRRCWLLLKGAPDAR